MNFLPALVISKDHLILCSTKQLADQLAGVAEKEGPAENIQKVPQYTLVEVSAAPIAARLLREPGPAWWRRTCLKRAASARRPRNRWIC